MQSLHSEWIRVQNVTNEKFHLVGLDVKELWRIQDQMASIQRENAQTIITQLYIFQESVNLMRNFDPDFYFRGQMNHKVVVLNSFLSCLYSTLKICRASLYTFHTNVFKAFALIVNVFFAHLRHSGINFAQHSS